MLVRASLGTELAMMQAIFRHATIQPHKEEGSESSDKGGDAGQPVPMERAVYKAVYDQLLREIGYCPERCSVPGIGCGTPQHHAHEFAS